MATSILIAKLLGPILMAAAISMIFNTRQLMAVASDFLKSPPLVYTTGVLAMLGGLSIVNSHNIWAWNWPVMITLFGWAMVIGGTFRIVLPSMVQSIGHKMMDNMSVTRVAGIAWLLIGMFLSYKGYI